MARFIRVGSEYINRDHVVSFRVDRIPFKSMSMSIVLTRGEVHVLHSPDAINDPIDVYAIERKLTE